LLAEFDVPLGAVLAGSSVRPDDLTADSFLPFSEMSRVLERAAELTKCPHFGLQLGSRFDHRVLGFPGRVLATAATLRQALSAFVNCQINSSTAAAAYLHRYGDDFAFGYGAYFGTPIESAQAYDVATAIGANMVRAITGGAVGPAEVLICRREPPDRRAYETILKAPVRFNQREACLILPRSAMDAAVLTADAAEHRKLVEVLLERQGNGVHPVTARVRHLLRPLLLQERATMTACAADLNLNPRTLRRQLAAEGTTFEAMLNEVRSAVAAELLAITDLSVGEVSAALSFAHQSTFVRSFRRWTGVSPSEWRRARRARAAAA
jgi:AraC-like DNA-binding protein